MSLTIRPITKEDAPRVALFADNKKIWDNVRDYFPHPYLLPDAIDFIEMVNDHKTNKIFAIANEDGLIGVIGLHPFTDIYRYTAEIGYWTGEPFWGMGYATQAVRWIVEYTWRATQIVRIEAGVFPFNIASMRVLEKCGFHKEGIKRNYLYKNDKICDEHTYVLLRPD